MTERLSTGLRNWLLEMGSMREAFKDFTIKIYSGAAPASADDVISGNLLVTITKGSGTAAARSIPDAWSFNLKTGATGVAAGTNVEAAVYFRYDRSGVQTGCTGAWVSYKGGVGATGLNWTLVSRGMAQTINDLHFPVTAVGGRTGSSSCTGYLRPAVFVTCDVPGDKIEIKTSYGGRGCTGATGARQIVKESSVTRGNWLWFASATGGAISKSTDTWSGEVVTTGVAGYFRIVQNDDDGTSSTAQIRLQGSVSTSGAELNLSNTSLTDGTTLTIDTFSVSLPAE
jgi:hypothetical protein